MIWIIDMVGMMHMRLTFHYLVYRDQHANRPLNDHYDRHFRKYHLHLDANAYAMSDVMNVHHVYDHVYDYDAHDDQMNELNEVNVVDALDDDSVDV